MNQGRAGLLPAPGERAFVEVISLKSSRQVIEVEFL